VTDWFLPAGGPGSPDEWCFQTVTTADIKIYADYQSYYDRLAGLMSQAKENCDVFLAGWAFTVHMVLTEKFGILGLVDCLQGALGRKARIRLMLTRSHSWSDNAKEVADAIKAKVSEAVIDDQLHPDTSFHQKAAFFKLDSSAHLFVGGMDVALGRRTDPGWFDVQAEIIGTGAHLGRKTLEERWESIKLPLGGLSSTQQSLPPGSGDAHRVQFVRTYPPFPTDTTNWKRTYAKNGEHTYYGLLSKAIGAATESIYIEEQFFQTMGAAPSRTNPTGGSSPRERSDLPDLPRSLDDLLQDAISRGVKLVVISNNRGGAANPPLRDTLVQTLKGGANPPVLLQVPSAKKFMHSKVWIFDDHTDDAFVVIGSANLWQPSLTSTGLFAEGEFGVGFTSKVDGTSLGFEKVSFARALRIKLWERLRQDQDPTYTWPRDKSATLDDEIKELRKPIGGADPFTVMA
jgi:phosphatidylserine/phosphatidylglycerophosphate/cardiolipin synthase-like enzyme